MDLKPTPSQAPPGSMTAAVATSARTLEVLGGTSAWPLHDTHSTRLIDHASPLPLGVDLRQGACSFHEDRLDLSGR